MILTALAFLGFMFVLASVLACPALLRDDGKDTEAAKEILWQTTRVGWMVAGLVGGIFLVSKLFHVIVGWLQQLFL